VVSFDKEDTLVDFPKPRPIQGRGEKIVKELFREPFMRL
jgi:hypothetical protein